jgi:hypothetical protein
LGWFLIGVIIGAIVLEVYNGILGFTPGWLRGGVSIVGFLIQLVAWIGLMLAVIGSLGSRVIRRDEMNYLLVGFGAIIITLELFLAIPFR